MIAPTLRSRFAQPSSRRPMPGAKRVVHGRVAQRALDADRAKRSVPEESGHPDDRIEPQQRNRGRGIVQVDLAAPQGADRLWRQAIDVDLEPERQRGARAQPGADATKRGRRLPACKRRVPPRMPRPRTCRHEDPVADRDHLPCVPVDDVIEAEIVVLVAAPAA